MKRKILSGLFGLALATGAHSQTANFYVNDSVINCPPDIPPQIDALNFVNNNFFSINFTTLAFVTELYDTSSTLNFTNYGTMIGNNGFLFDTAPTDLGLRRMARSFYNSGNISVGSLANTNSFGGFFFSFFGSGLPQLVISATNVIDSGTNIVGVDGLFKITGKSVDLNRGVITMEGFENSPTNALSSFFFNNEGIFTRYAAVGSNVMSPASLFENFPPRTPTGLTLPGATFYAQSSTRATPTNLFVQAVFLSDTNSAISNNVYFSGFQTVVEWSARITNIASGAILTNYLYLFDDFGFSGSNILAFDGIPVNYFFLRSTSPLNLGAPAVPDSPAGWFFNQVVTNEYAAWGATVAPTTALPGALPGDALTNLPGRIEIIADDMLNLSRTKINGLNYMRLRSTNHFAGSSRAQITIPYSDIALGSTNGSLTITNLLIPTVPRFNGEVDLWSGRWTNSDPVFEVYYHVLFVDSRLAEVAQALVRDLSMRSTNMVLSDVMNVQRSFLFEGENLTITTNGPGSQATRGEVNLLNTDITWSSATPRLKNLTNNGAIRTQNSIFFGGSRTTPYFSTNFNEPYLSMVNRGEITDQGTLIWANYFENTGLISSGVGSFTLQSLNAFLRGNSFLAGGDISIFSDSLVISNHVLQAGRSLTLAVTNLLDDGSVFNPVAGITNQNNWTAGGGVNLLAKPALGSLLGTTIYSSVAPGREVFNRWAADDLGCSPAGFSNNAVVGRLILDGGFDSLFTFTGTGANNALYVDYLEFRNFTTNRDAMGNYLGVQIDPNMHIYFGQAMANGASIAEKLDGKNDGRFCWVAGHAGFYSSTNFVYPDGTTNVLNAALVDSHNLDSDCDGLPNYVDTDPIFLVTTAGLPDATAFTAYSAGLQAYGGPASPYTWALAPGSAALPDGLGLSSGGVISGTPTQSGVFTFTVRVTVTTICGPLAADRTLTLTVNPGAPMLSVAIEHHSPPGARVAWQTLPNSMNYLYYRPSLTSGNWQLLTNFMSAAGGPVSVWDPVSTNATRYYRVLMSQP